MKTRQKAGWVVGTSVFLAMGCGGYGSDDKDTAPSAKVTASASEVMIGSTIELNAAGSVYDSLLWSINQTTISACDDHELCILTMDTAGTFEIALDATTSATKRATVTVQVVDNPTAKKASASTASTAAAAGSSSTAFSSPNNIAGLKLWLDASDASTLFTNTACTTAVSADGQAVGCWKDKKSGGTPYNFTQSIGANQPTYKTSIVNNNSIVRTDGVNDSLIATALNDTTGGKEDLKFTNYTIFMLVKPTNLTSDNRGIFSCAPQTGNGNDWNNVDGISLAVAAADNRVVFLRDGANPPVAQVEGMIHQNVSTNFQLLSFRASAGTLKSWKNGGNLLSDTYSDLTEINPYACSVGDRWYSGATGGTPGQNDYAEVLIYNSALSDSDRQQVEAYLASKWGITLSTPAFDPNNISGLSLWLDASDSSTLFQNSACTTAVTTNNQAVGCWKDKKTGGTAYDFIQATGTNQPLYKTSSSNGLSTIYTDGSNDYLQTGNVSDITGGKTALKFTATTIFTVAKINSLSSNNSAILGCAPSNGYDYNSEDGFNLEYELDNTVHLFRLWGGGGDPINVQTPSVGTSSYFLASTQLSGGTNPGTASMWTGGGLLATDAYSDMNEINPYSCMIGSRANNTGGVTNPYGNNNYGEILIYNSALSTANREQVESYLISKWGSR